MNSTDTQVEGAAAESPEKQKLSLDVQVSSPSACERKVSVTIAREDVDRYLDRAYSELMPNAQVPGFRAGRVPRKLVEQRFREQVADQVKGSLLMDSMTQISEDHDFSAISEPDFEFDAIELPEKGPMKFEFSLEVRPEFEMPEWKGLQLERLQKDFQTKDVDIHLDSVLREEITLEPADGPVEQGSYVVVNWTVRHQGRVVSSQEEVTLLVQANLSFPDGSVEGFDTLLTGAQAGDKRSTSVVISHDAGEESLQGQSVDIEFEVLEVKRGILPELNDEMLERLGGFESEGDLRDAILNNLRRRMEYEQQRRTRAQITKLLTQSANWELPPDLVRRQSRRELERAILELRRSGFSEEEVRVYENELRQNSLTSTKRALQEHFILERIAEEHQIEASAEDYEQEIQLIALQSREPVRRVRARIEKKGWMDALRNQIIERKVLELITEHANFKDVKFEPEKQFKEAVEVPLCGRLDADIPEAKHAGESQPLQQPVDRS